MQTSEGRRVGRFDAVFRVLRPCVAAGLLLACLPAAAQTQRREVRATDGLADMSGIGLGRGEVATLGGDWDFWPGRLLGPEDLDAAGSPKSLAVPLRWSRSGDPEIAAASYGTYRLRVTGLPPDLPLALSLRNTVSASRVFADGRLVLESGRPGTDRASETPRWDSSTVAVEAPADGELDLLVQVSSHVDLSAGLVKPVLLGERAALDRLRTSRLLAEAAQASILGFVALYTLVLFALRPDERALLFAGLLAANFALRSLVYGEFLIYAFLPGLGFESLFRLGYLTLALPFVLLAAFFHSLYPDLVPKGFLGAGLAAGLVQSLWFLAGPTPLVARLLPLTLAAIAAFSLYFLAVVALAFRRRLPGAAIIAAGFVPLVLTIGHDVLVNRGLVRAPFVAPAGMILFFVCVAATAARLAYDSALVRSAVLASMARAPLSLAERGLSANESAFVLELVRGKSVKEIAAERGLSPSTVRNSLSRSYPKLGVDSVKGLFALAAERELRP